MGLEFGNEGEVRGSALVRYLGTKVPWILISRTRLLVAGYCTRSVGRRRETFAIQHDDMARMYVSVASSSRGSAA
jgi:hypothetical protein